MEFIFFSNIKFCNKNDSLKRKDLNYGSDYLLVKLNNDEKFNKC